MQHLYLVLSIGAAGFTRAECPLVPLRLAACSLPSPGPPSGASACSWAGAHLCGACALHTASLHRACSGRREGGLRTGPRPPAFSAVPSPPSPFCPVSLAQSLCCGTLTPLSEAYRGPGRRCPTDFGDFSCHLTVPARSKAALKQPEDRMVLKRETRRLWREGARQSRPEGQPPAGQGGSHPRARGQPPAGQHAARLPWAQAPPRLLSPVSVNAVCA